MRVKKTLSLDDGALAKGEQLRALLHFADVSSLVEQLIREEWERRHGPAQIANSPPIPGQVVKRGKHKAA